MLAAHAEHRTQTAGLRTTHETRTPYTASGSPLEHRDKAGLERSSACICIRRYSSLFSRVPGDPHHCRTQQSVLELITALPLFKHFVISRVWGVDHFDRLMEARIELLSLGINRLHSQLR